MKSIRGIEVLRRLMGETKNPRLAIPIGSFRFRKRAAKSYILAWPEGYRLALQLRDEPTPEELAEINTVTGLAFEPMTSKEKWADIND